MANVTSSDEVFIALATNIIPTALTAAELLDIGSRTFEVLSGTQLELTTDARRGTVMFAIPGGTSVTVVEADVDGCAGDTVIHRIDGFLV
jgi:hypothetical protein